MHLAAAVALLSATGAAAQLRTAPVRAPLVVPNAGVAAMGLRPAAFTPGLNASALPSAAVSFSPSLMPSPVLPKAFVPGVHSTSLRTPAAQAAYAADVMPAAIIRAVPQVAPVEDLALIGNLSAPSFGAEGVRGTLETLGGSLNAAKSGRGSVSQSLDLSFDGGTLRRGADAVQMPEVSASLSGNLLARPGAARSAVTEPAAPKTPSSNKAPGTMRAGLIAAVAVLGIAGALLAAPSFAIGAAGGFAATAVAYVHPLGSIAAAAIGAIYGLIVARKPDGTSPSTVDILTSVIRHALIAGAGTYIAIDLAAVYLMGMAPLAVSPLPVTLATAALAQGAFQGKFTEAATTPADRVLGAFPAVAAALGLNIGVFFAAPTMLLTTAIGAMSITGAAAAIYAAVYQPGKSAEGGPTAMARGFVLQSLMTGLALSMTSPYMTVPFLALAAWGFWDVMSTTLMALEARLPEPVRRLYRRD